MVSRSNRKQVNFNVRGPGLDTRQALQVPQGQAQRRSGVGQNAQNMGSALSRLGSALGALGTSMKANEKFDHHGEKRRIERYMNTASQRSPEERVAIRQVTSMPASPTREMKQITDFRTEVAPKMAQQLYEIEKGWADNGYTLVDPETGERKEITSEFINEYFKEYLQYNVWDVYGKPEGEEGRLRDPQVSMAYKLIEQTKQGLVRRWSKYKLEEHERESKEIATKDAGPSLEAGYKNGLRGQDLLDDWMKSGETTVNEAHGSSLYQGQKRSEIVENRLRELHRKIQTPGHAQMAVELLEGRLRNKDGGLGAKLRDSYPQIVPQIIKQAQKVFNKELYREFSNKAHAENILELGKKGSAFSFETRNFVSDDGKEFTLSAKEQEVFATNYLKRLAGVSSGSDKDPEKKWEEHQKMITWSAGTPIVDPEIQNLFTNANFGIYANSETDFGKLLTVYRDIKAIDPTRLNDYIKDPKVRLKMRHMDRILSGNPGLSPQEALRQVQKGVDDEGKVVSWSDIPGGTVVPGSPRSRQKSYGRSFSAFANDLDDEYNLDMDEKKYLEQSMKMRLVDDYERGRMDADGDNNVSIREFEAAMKQEADELMKLRTYLGGQKLVPPPGVNAEGYKTIVQGFIKQMQLQFPGLPKDISIKPIEGNPGLSFVDKKTGQVIDLHWGQGTSGKAHFNHQDILAWSKTAEEGAIDAKAIRKGGGAIFRRDAPTQNAEIERARNSITNIDSWIKRLVGAEPRQDTGQEHPAAVNK